MEKTIAHWIFYEDSDMFYCATCIGKRLKEANKNKEFSEDIDYENGEECGFFLDYAYAYVEEEVHCCKCSAPLLSMIDN